MKHTDVPKAVSLLLSSLIASCACGSLQRNLEEYLRRDAQGERLSYETVAEIEKLTEQEYPEPGWDETALTTGYKIRSLVQAGNTAKATILFENVWISPTREGFNARDVGDSTVEVHLVNVSGCWKIGHPFYRPHVYPEPLREYMEGLLQEARARNDDPHYIRRLQDELDGIQEYIRTITKRGRQ